MKTRCPTCKTRYDIDPEALLEADGLARCFRCGTVFEMVPEGSIEPNIIDMPTERPAFETDEDSVFLEDLETDASAPVAHNADDSVVVRSVSSEQADIRQQPETNPTATETADTIENAADAGDELPFSGPHDLEPADANAPSDDLPFSVPQDLEPIEPSPDDVQDIAAGLHEKRSWRGFVYGLIALLLLAGIGMQLAWQQRETLLAQYPILEPLCAHLECVPQIIRAPEKIRILQRDISPTAGEPDSLTLRVSMRNDADVAQPLPDLQLSLVNNDGGVLIRRRLSPSDYLGEAPPPKDIMAAGEVVTITLDFKDPGYEASGFVIDFF